MKVKKGGNIAWKGKIYTAGQELPKDYKQALERASTPAPTKPKTSNKDK